MNINDQRSQITVRSETKKRLNILKYELNQDSIDNTIEFLIRYHGISRTMKTPKAKAQQ